MQLRNPSPQYLIQMQQTLFTTIQLGDSQEAEVIVDIIANWGVKYLYASDDNSSNYIMEAIKYRKEELAIKLIKLTNYNIDLLTCQDKDKRSTFVVVS